MNVGVSFEFKNQYFIKLGGPIFVGLLQRYTPAGLTEVVQTIDMIHNHLLRNSSSRD